MKSKSFALVAILLTACAFSAMADAVAPGILVLGPDGTITQQPFYELDRIEFGDDALTVVAQHGRKTDVPYANIDKVEIGAMVYAGSAVKNALAEGNVAVWPSPVKSVLNVAGAAPGTEVAVFGLDGARVAYDVVGTETLSVNLSNLTSGSYVVTVGNSSFKIVKE